MKSFLLSLILIFFICFEINSQPLDSPILTEPPDIDVVVPLTVILQWEAVTGAQSYEVQISLNSSFTSPVNLNTVNVIGTNYQVPPGILNPFTVYYWRVRSINQFGASEYSDPWSFRTAGTPAQEISSLQDVVDNYLSNHMNQANILNHKLDLALHQYNMNHLFQARLHMGLFKLRVVILELSNFINNQNGDRLIFVANRILTLFADDNNNVSFDLTPKEYRLMQNYPNPFNPSTTIEYTIPKEGYVSLKVFDITGKEVASLVNKYQNAGSYLVTWDASNNSSGIYFYRINSGDYSATKRMVLNK